VIDARRIIEAIWRIESPRLIATLARLVGNVGLAEELASDAFVAALEQWPERGIPDNPGGWLTATAKHKAVDLIRRERTRDATYAQLAEATQGEPVRGSPVPSPERLVEDPIGDDLLALVFVACHPVLPQESKVALTLRLLGGLTTEEIARAYLVPSTTVGQRISRAKRTLTEAHVPIEIPQPNEFPTRVSAVLEVVYLIFNEGYSASSGSRLIRRDLAGEAIRLGRVLVGLLPGEPEVHGLVALMELQASRFDARIGPDGSKVLLEDQDRRRWDRILITRGLAALDRAIALRRPLGPYTLQAAIAACHARAPTWEATDWHAIVALYDALGSVAPSPVVEINRAIAILMADGPEAALQVLDAVRDDPRLRRYHLLGAVRGDVLTRLGRYAEAANELENAATLATTSHDRIMLKERAAAAASRM
jgi:RNA polymerase sigma-70 factor, ECF subfamily